MKKIITSRIDRSNILFYNLLSRENIDFIINESLHGNGKALDIGSGIGFMSNALSFDYDVLAIDKDIQSLNFIKHKYGCDTLCINFSVSKLPKYKYDLILLCEVIEQIPSDKHFEFIQEICERLNQGGIFLITTPCSDGLFKLTNPMYDYKKGGYSRIELIDLIKKTGLTIVNVRYNMIFFSRLILELQKLFLDSSKINGKQSRINNIDGTVTFKLYKFIFPIVYALSKLDKFLAMFLNGTGLMISARKGNKL